MRNVAEGAEAIIYQDEDTIIKERVKKSYRHPDLDKDLRHKRTKQEASILTSLTVTPDVHNHDKTTITMEAVNGDLLTDVIETEPSIMTDVGAAVTRVHDAGVYHGDLTTSNIILADEPIIIDFGLGGYTKRVEDKAVDIYLLKKAVISKHVAVHEEAWTAFLNGYTPEQKDDILDQFETVKQRGRYK